MPHATAGRRHSTRATTARQGAHQLCCARHPASEQAFTRGGLSFVAAPSLLLLLHVWPSSDQRCRAIVKVLPPHC